MRAEIILGILKRIRAADESELQLVEIHHELTFK